MVKRIWNDSWRKKVPVLKSSRVISVFATASEMTKVTIVRIPRRSLATLFVVGILVFWEYSASVDNVLDVSLVNPGGDVKSIAITMKSKENRKFFPVPEDSRKLFWTRKSINHKLYEPVIRAFHLRGYSLTDDQERARFLWSDHPSPELYQDLQPWQRYSWIPDIHLWDDKDSMANHMNQYYAQKEMEPLYSFPESYLLHVEEDFRRFQRRLRDGGIDVPWVIKVPNINQGKGVEIVGPHSQPLLDIMSRKQVQRKTRRVVQKYICDEMTYFGRKFDFRIFWMVASVDPLVVLYQTQHNYVRIGAAAYDETDFSNTRSHLTTHTFGANEGKATWDEFKIYIREFHALQGRRLGHIEDPFQHLENQVKHVLAHLSDAFKNMTYHTRGISSENAFTWHAADMIIDNDLDVYIIEGTDGPGKDEDYDFRIEMHNSIFGDMISIVEEVSRRQESGYSLDVKAMEQDGVLGSYEVVYDDGRMFEYSFARPEKRGCSVSEKQNKGNNKVDVSDNILEVVRTEANLTALPKLPVNAPVKTFYMEGRTGQAGEPIARSLRSKGWVPLDDKDVAQLIFEKIRPEKFPKHLQPWQFFNHFPREISAFRKLELPESRTKACDPLLYNGREFLVKVFWLVLSLDPLLVFFHDGHLLIPYDENDENEFVMLYEDGSDEPRFVWRGSWAGFEHFLKEVSQDSPMLHVRGQMKSHLINTAKDLKSISQTTKIRNKSHSFGIFTAEFHLDRNLHVMEPSVSETSIYSEGYQEIVDLHDSIFGSAFNLIELYNSTSSDFSAALDSARGRYELIVDGETGVEFRYDYDGRPSASCY